MSLFCLSVERGDQPAPKGQVNILAFWTHMQVAIKHKNIYRVARFMYFFI